MIVRASLFMPFADGQPHVRLQFPFDQQLVDELKLLGRRLRPLARPHSPVGWLAEYRAWFVRPSCWLTVATRLVDLGYAISADQDVVRLGRPSTGYGWLPAPRSPTRDPNRAGPAGYPTAVLVPRCIHCGAALSGGDHCGRCAALDAVAQTAADAWEGENG
jgi:hypothetical protein